MQKISQRNSLFDLPPVMILAFTLIVLSTVVFAQIPTELVVEARKGNNEAQVTLGEMFAKGIVTGQDFKSAAYWFNRAARDGNVQAQYNLGYMYASGFGVKRSPRFAAGWYQRAAKSGHKEAQFSLSLLYSSGQGIRQDNGKALHWLQKAAEQWHGEAQFNLAYMYLYGRGVKQDLVQAYMWFDLASQSGDRFSAKQKYSLAQRLPGVKIEEARQLARAWEKKFPKNPGK